MTVTPDRFPGAREEEELKLLPEGADPLASGGMKYVSDKFRHRDANGVHDDTDVRVSANDTGPAPLKTKFQDGGGIKWIEKDDGNDERIEGELDADDPGPYLFEINPANLIRTGTRNAGVSEGYAVNEFQKNTLDYGAWSTYWRRTSATAVELKVKFVLVNSGTGTTVRIVARSKARADGENITTGFDTSTFDDVTVTGGAGGDVYTATLTLTPADFAQDDAVAINIGRDGTTDSFSKAVALIAIRGKVV